MNKVSLIDGVELVMYWLWFVTTWLWLIVWGVGGFTDFGPLGCAMAAYALAEIEEKQ